MEKFPLNKKDRFIKNVTAFYNLSANFFFNYDTLFKDKNILSKTFVDEFTTNLNEFNNEQYLRDCFADSEDKQKAESSNFSKDDYDEKFLFKFRNYTNVEKDRDILYFKSYPVKNYLMIITNNLYLSLLAKRFIFRFQPLQGFKDLTYNKIEKIDLYICNNDNKIKVLFEILEETANAFEEVSYINPIIDKNISDRFNEFYLDLIENFKEKGLLTFLGIRQTPGSLGENLPPKLEILINNFNELNTLNNDKEGNVNTNKQNVKLKSPSILTVGARALSKHSHRSSEGFWPECKGKEIEKNIKSREILLKFLNECVWINIHGLPHAIPIVELRNNLGYGIRWRIDGLFRGFLEPQMDDGHEKGWRH